jgi:integrase
MFGDLPLEDLRHWHIVSYRDAQLARGLKPASVRKKHTYLNAMLNMAFKHLDIDRLSPFRGLYIPNEGKDVRQMIPVTDEIIHAVKKSLLNHWIPHKLVALVQLNTGLRLSEPVYAKLEDCVLDHDIPHIWVRPNEFSDRKTKASIRAVPLVGASLEAAKLLVIQAKAERSEWLVPNYARHNGSNSCSAAINKHLRSFEFRSHMFRHALVDRLKACDDIQTKLAESITGHSSAGSEYDHYGTIGYTLEQKRRVLERIKV